MFRHHVVFLVPVFLGILFLFFFICLMSACPHFVANFCFYFYFLFAQQAASCPLFWGGLSLSFCLFLAQRALTPVLGAIFFFPFLFSFSLFCFLFHFLNECSPPILCEIFVFVFYLKLLNKCLPLFGGGLSFFFLFFMSSMTVNYYRLLYSYKLQ